MVDTAPATWVVVRPTSLWHHTSKQGGSMSHTRASIAVLVVLALGMATSLSGADRNSDRDDSQPASPHFSARDIRRTYGFSCSGTAFGAPYAQLGIASCDGIDTCRATGFTNQDG